MLLHLKQAGKFEGVRGIVLGEFPESEPPEGSSVTVADVCRRILGPSAHSDCLWRAGGPHDAPDADDAARRARATSRLGRRASRNSGTGGARMTRPIAFSSLGNRRRGHGAARGHAGRKRPSRDGLGRGRLSAGVDAARKPGDSLEERFRRRQSRSRAGHRGHRQRAVARQSGSRSGARSAKFRTARCRKRSRNFFCRGTIRWSSPARTEKPRRRPCSPGFCITPGGVRIF